jgi:hypothetical protein
MPGPLEFACDAHISRCLPAIKQRVANIRANKLDPRKWCVVVATLEADNPAGVGFALRLHPWGVPVRPGQGFESLIEIDDAMEGFDEVGVPSAIVQQMKTLGANVPAGSVLVVCSVAEGVAATYIPLGDKDLPAANLNSNPLVTTPAMRRRRKLMNQSLREIAHCCDLMLAEGLDPADYSVIIIDPNSNAMGVELLEEVEGNPEMTAKYKADAAQGKALPYYNFAKNSQLGPFMADLKIEVDGTVKDAAISAPGLPGRLRVVVSTQNGATIIDIPRPNKKG